MPVTVKTTATAPEGVPFFKAYRDANPNLEPLDNLEAWTVSQPGFISTVRREVSNLVTEETIVFQDTESFTNYQKNRESHSTFLARRAYNLANNISSVVEVSVS